MAIRITGMNSGLDTDSIITELVKAKSAKVNTLKSAQIKQQYKMDALKDLNAKVVKLYNNTVSTLSYKSAYSKKITEASDSNAVKVTASNSAMDSVQSLKISELATSGYLTGGKIQKSDGSTPAGTTKLTELGIASGSSFDITVGGKSTKITIDDSTTLDNLASQLKSAGANANYDAKNGRLYIAAKDSGKAGDFSLTANTAGGTNALDKLGILTYDSAAIGMYEKYADMDTDSNAKAAELDSMIKNSVAAYKTKIDGLDTQITAKKKELADYADKYAEGYPSEGSLEDLVNDADAVAAMRQEIADLEATLESGTELTADEASRHSKLKGQMSFVDAYEAAATEINNLETQKADAEQYLNADGTASDLLKGNMAAELDEKIAVAVDTIANKDSLRGSADAKRIEGQDAKITLNGAEYTSSSNTFEINGLTIECKEKTGDKDITLITKNDTSAIYDMVKSFIKEYNELINEMDKLYNAESAKGYEPLTDDEKEAMSESEVEKWEEKIKTSILRRDSSVSTMADALKEITSQGFEVNGKKMFLFDFGIEKAGYFNSSANEKNAFNINGDSDYSSVATEDNVLKAMISSDPDAVSSFFSQMAMTLKDKMFDLMKTTEFSSSFTMYDDKKMQTDYASYTTKISAAEKKLTAYEDKWYSKFSSMETALAKMQSNSSAITGLLGG